MIADSESLFARRPALTALILLVIGILISTAVNAYHVFSLGLTLVSIFTVLWMYLTGKTRGAGIAAAILLLAIGWYRADIASGPRLPNHIGRLAEIGGISEFYGRVTEEPDIRNDRTYLIVEADSVSVGDLMIPTFGRVRVKIINGGSRYDHADILRMTGFLYSPRGARNPGGFDYGWFLRSKEIFAAMSVSGPHAVAIIKKGDSFLSVFVSPLREYLVSISKRHLPATSAAILSGFILGERRDIPQGIQTLFRDTGTLHLMAVSGSNVAMVLAVLSLPLALFRVRRRVRVIILIPAILFFAVLTRLEPSVVRASIMAVIGLLAYGWTRKPDYINLLGFAGLVMLLWRPTQLFDIGLQLSFAATFGIIYAAPRIAGWFSFLDKYHLVWLRWFISLSLATLAAQAAVLPLIARYFNNIPISGLAANIPVGLLAGFSTSFGILFYFLSVFGDWMANLTAIPLRFILDWVVYLLRFFSTLPYANIKAPSLSWPAVAAYWAILYMTYEYTVNRRLSGNSIIAGLLFLNVTIWQYYFTENPEWKIDFIDIGRNRGWIFTGNDDKAIACFDLYDTDDAADRVLIPYLYSYYGGRLDYLLTSTPGSPQIGELVRYFSPIVFSVNDLSQTNRGPEIGRSENQSALPDYVKVVWGESDNKDDGSYDYPGIQINTNDGVLIMTAWMGTEILKGYHPEENIKLLEMSWSVYAQSRGKMIIDDLDPEVVVFSPDRYSVAMPRDRAQLTHNQNRVYSTSICGGFEFSYDGRITRIRMMKPILTEE